MVGVGLVGEQQPFGKGIDDPRAAATTIINIIIMCTSPIYWLLMEGWYT